MAVPLAQVSTVKQAYDYAIGSAGAAASKCPAAVSQYNQLAANVKAGALGQTSGPITIVQQAAFENSIMSINAYCNSNLASVSSSAGGVSAGGSKVSITPDSLVSAGVSGDSTTLLIALAIGAAAYFLLGKKSPASRKTTKRRTTKRRTTSRRRRR